MAESTTSESSTPAAGTSGVGEGQRYDIGQQPAHLGRRGSVSVEPAFSGELSWYDDYVTRHVADGDEGRLVSMYTFTEGWSMWEMHPVGSELVLCVAGTIDLRQELPDGAETTTTLRAGQYAVNAPGVWHTADVEGSATVVFITAGVGTEHRSR